MITPSGVLHQAVVEIYGDRVANYYEFRDELPMTEWLGGEIIIQEGKAYQNGSLLLDDGNDD